MNIRSQQERKQRRLWLVMALLVPVILFLAWRAIKPEPAPTIEQLEVGGIYFPKPEYITPFQLTDTNNHAFSDQNLLGHWSLVFFGFTYCPDVCPTTLAMLDSTLKSLKSSHPDMTVPDIVFVSVDPARDNLTQLDKYVHFFNPEFKAVTGTETQLETLARQMGVIFDKVYMNPDDGDKDNYLMEHSTSLTLINPEGGIQAIFTAPHESSQLSKDISQVYQQYHQL